MKKGLNHNYPKDGITYHIQTEVGEQDSVVTHVFVAGAIIHTDKHYVLSNDENMVQGQIKHQHRKVLKAIRDGEIVYKDPKEPVEEPAFGIDESLSLDEVILRYLAKDFDD